jgi:dihydropteroate synthase
MTTLNCGGKLLDLGEPKVMGILNCSPESFFDGAKNSDSDSIPERVNAMLTAGAVIIDVGGMSTRPGAPLISQDEELTRVLPALKLITKEFPEALVSIDTTKAEVARQAVDNGATMINDVSAGSLDPELWPLVARLQVPYVLMHMKGTPADMQDNPVYDDVTTEVIDFLSQRAYALHELGVHDIIIDPGFGFGKTVEHNYTLLATLDAFRIFDRPILVGLSRKSMISKPLHIKTDEALNGTTALHVLALLNGANILRVHDVKEAMQAIRLVSLYESQLRPHLENATT